MSINVYFQTIDVELIQSLVFGYVLGMGTLESLRPQLRSRWDVLRAFVPWQRLLSEVSRDGSDKLPDWFDGEAFNRRHFFIVENAPDRVAELMDLYHNAPDEDTVLRLIRSQLAILDPESVNEPDRWVPKPVKWDWDVEEQVERKMALLVPYAATPDMEPKKQLDNKFTSDLLKLNEGLQLVVEVDDYPLETVGGWATADFRKCLKPPDELFRPLFAAHPELKKALAVEGRYPWSGAGMYVKPANVPRMRRAVEASLLQAEKWRSPNEFALNALLELADLLRYGERRGLGLIERCA